MLKKIFLIIISFNLLSHCEYKPVYSNQNKVDYKIVITSFTGDREINNLISKTLKRNSKENSNKIINISLDTKYSKNTLARNNAGTITDYQANVISKFTIEKGFDFKDGEVITLDPKLNTISKDKYQEAMVIMKLKK